MTKSRTNSATWRALPAAALLAFACSGDIETSNSGEGSNGAYGLGDPSQPGESVPAAIEAGQQSSATALRRLARREIENSLNDLFGSAGLAEKYLPPDPLDPFDTATATKTASAVFVEGSLALAFDIATAVSADAATVQALSGCAPAAATDSVCLSAFVEAAGLRLWRRPLTPTEVQSVVGQALPFATERNDFYTAVRFALLSMIQSPGFLYRSEIGVADPQNPLLRRLDNFELASRLSYLAWGSAPGPELLSQAASGIEFTDQNLSEITSTLLADPRADRQAKMFHELWFDYRSLRAPGDLVDSMLTETDMVLDKVLVTDRGAWSDLFSLRGTFVNQQLADHYGINANVGSGFGWVDYQNAERSGVLAHGSILSLAAKNTDDTSPTIRGKYVATRLLCREVPPPPPDVNTDDVQQPGPDACKSEIFQQHRDKSAACHACHQLMDPIGFGMERFDGLGRYRTTEPQNAACQITGDGELTGVGPFNGVAQLVQLMRDSGELTACGVEQLFHFAMGREAQDADSPALDRVHERFVSSGEDFRELLLGLATDPSFRYRLEEQ